VHGTSINGVKLAKGGKRLLTNGDTIAIAQFDVVFDRVAQVEEGEEKTGHTRFISANVVRGVMQGLANGEDPYMRVMDGPRDGQKIPIAAAHEYIVGRDETADIPLDDDLVSRRHVKIRRDWAGVSVEDLGSRNGLKVNKKKVKRVTLKDRDEVQIGNVKLLFIDPAEIRDAPVVMPANDDENTHALQEAPVDDPLVAHASDANVQVADDAGDPDAQASGEAQPDAENAPDDGGESSNAGETGDESDYPSDEDAGAEFDGERQDDGEGNDLEPKARFDFSNKQNLIVLGIVAFFAIIGLVILGLLLAGA